MWFLDENLYTVDFYIGAIWVSWVGSPHVYDKPKFDEWAEKCPKFAAYGKRFAKINEKYLKARPPKPM